MISYINQITCYIFDIHTFKQHSLKMSENKIINGRKNTHRFQLQLNPIKKQQQKTIIIKYELFYAILVFF